MVTRLQELGSFGELLVAKLCSCPKCKRQKNLKRLPPNFKCADVICEFCGYLGQVKTSVVADINKPPKTILGAAWAPQKERMEAGIYFPLFIVLVQSGSPKNAAVYYLPADLQNPDLYITRKPLSEGARRAGWTGFYYDLNSLGNRLVRLI